MPQPLPGSQLGAKGGALAFRDLPAGRGLGVDPRRARPVQFSGAQFPGRAAESEARLGREPRSQVPGHHHLPPPCRPRGREAALGGAGIQPWGSSRSCQPPLPAALRRLQRGKEEQLRARAALSTRPVSALDDPAPRPQTCNQRVRRPRSQRPRASACDWTQPEVIRTPSRP